MQYIFAVASEFALTGEPLNDIKCISERKHTAFFHNKISKLNTQPIKTKTHPIMSIKMAVALGCEIWRNFHQNTNCLIL